MMQGRMPIWKFQQQRSLTPRSWRMLPRSPEAAGNVLAFRDFLRAKGHWVTRLKVIPAGEAKPIFSDLPDETADVLVEAKGSVTREQIRMAIGQLADYSRFAVDAHRAVLVPDEPREDLKALAKSQGIAVVWPASGGYTGDKTWW
jgi:hypothetical protein